jgi:D-lactate dehydrogenase
MKAIFYEVKDWERLYLQQRLKDWTLHFEAGTADASADADGSDAACLSVFIYSALDETVLAKFPSVRMIATRSTGYDHIDLEGCRRRAIAVSNVPSYGENTVAEHTFALILMLSRKVHQSFNQVRAGHLERAMLTGFDLQGKTLGVVGAGRIGLHAIRIGRGFGMRVLTYDVRRDPFLADLLGFSYAPLDALLAESDIVSLHCPLIPATRHIIGRAQFDLMKQGALLVNTARGGLVDTDALIEALDSGRLGGAGLDVIEGEELIKEERQLLHEPHTLEQFRAATRNRLLLARDDVVYTPHNAFNSQEALERILDTTIANLEAFRAGTPNNLVSLPSA